MGLHQAGHIADVPALCWQNPDLGRGTGRLREVAAAQGLQLGGAEPDPPIPLPQDMAALHHTALLLVAPGFAGVADPASQPPTPFPTGGPVPLRIKHAGPALLIRVALGCGLGAPILPWRSQSAYRNPPRLPQGSKEA